MASAKHPKGFTLPDGKGSKLRGLINAAKGHAMQYGKGVTLVRSVATGEQFVWKGKAA